MWLKEHKETRRDRSRIQPLNCNNTSNTITASTNEPDVTYEWTGPNGFYSDSNEIEVDESGEYFLLVETENGCSTELIVEVVENDEVQTYPLEKANDALRDLRSGHVRGAKVLQINEPVD